MRLFWPCVSMTSRHTRPARAWAWGWICACLLAGPPVRAAAPRLLAQGDTVYDRKTDLTWQRCTLGQRWDGHSRCLGDARRLTFDEARQMQTGGWRVPTLDELLSIVTPGRVPTIDPVLFPDTPPLYYWATDNREVGMAWYVFFENGRANHYFPPHTNRDLLRLVRSGRWAPAPATRSASAS